MIMKDLTALVTGGSSGIGLSTAKLFLEAGANVMIAGRDGDRLQKARLQLGDYDGRLQAVQGDVSSEGYASKLVGETLKKFNSLNILVNNAGVFRMAGILETEEEDYDYMLDVNLKGTWMMSKQAVRVMKDRGGGAIVNVSSFLGTRGAFKFPSSAYSAAKGGILALTKSLAVELAPWNIRVNAVVPAVVNTPMLESIADGPGVEKLLADSKKFHPLGRAGEPEDVARAISFLASPENSWISGAALPVDGARSAV